MKLKPKPFSISPRYRSFINARDRALEVILNRYLNASSSVVGEMHDQVLDIVEAMAAKGKFSPLLIKKYKPTLEHRIDWIAHMTAQVVYDHFRRLRVSTYTLAHVGGVEAMSRATGKQYYYDLQPKDLMSVIKEDAPSGGPLKERIEFYFDNLKRKIIEAITRSMLLEEPKEEAIARINKAFPRKRKVTAVSRELKPIPFREAKKKFPGDLEDQTAVNVEGDNYSASVGFVDDDAWQQTIDDYLGKELPGPRGPQDIVDVMGEDRYEWEVEQEMMQDFVTRVRQGDEDAANENGIVDMMWISIIDNKTDDCCVKRDGFTTTEIENKLNGEWKDDQCRAKVSPAHFRCRCRMVPASQDLPETPPKDYGDFDQWLNAA